MKQLPLILLTIVLLTTSCFGQKPVLTPIPKPITTPAPAPKQQGITRINITNKDGFLIGVFVFADSLYYKGVAGTEHEAALSFYNSMNPSESTTLFIDELFKVHEAYEQVHEQVHEAQKDTTTTEVKEVKDE
ncbi:hypothetical protein LCGC14_1548310 [marine sediment metagenome]|uniref:Uncharacterized protein n=1 Tax=marine sediment metagenome TaxID=412755 RepID=A0A0F9LRZ0_9ZZZZ